MERIISGTSRAWVLEKHGGPERLQLRSRPDPVPGAGEVRVAVRAIGLNFADLFVRAGVYPRTPNLPMVPGMEVSGIVDALGPDTSDSSLAPGQPVVAVPIFGGHAEKVVCAAMNVFPLPAGVDLVEAAAMPVSFLTAHHIASEAHIESGERVVVTAAAGGVGTALLQILRERRARVLALAGSDAKLELCRTLGAEDASSYAGARRRIEASFGGRADVVADAIGEELFYRLWSSLDRGGRYVLYGFAAAATRGGISRLRAFKELVSMRLLAPYSLVQSCRSLIGFNLSLLPSRTVGLRRAAEEIFEGWAAAASIP
jgi:NADPH:quinone reductase-like Zn-dependent oxidoreductase